MNKLNAISSLRRKPVFALLLMLLLGPVTYAQEITGRIVDSNAEPLGSVVVVLQNPDSLFVAASVTDSLGVFKFAQGPRPYRLVIQQLSYKPRVVLSEETALGDILLEDDPYQLQSAVVKDYSSSMSVSESGALSFASDKIVAERPVSSALDLLKEIPCVESNGDNYMLVGTTKTAITINGKSSKMSAEQLMSFLSSLPAEDIQAVDLYYKSPAKSGVVGASIDFVIKKKRAERFETSGVVSVNDLLAHYNAFGFQGYASFFKKNISFEVGLDKSWDHDYVGLDLASHHTVAGRLYEIEQQTSQDQRAAKNMVFANMDYDISEDANLTVQYSGAYNKTSNRSTGLTMMESTPVSSENRLSGQNNMTDVSVDFTYDNLEIGTELLHYNQQGTQLLDSEKEESSLSGTSSQKDFIVKGYVHHSVKIGKLNTLSYGVDYSHSRSTNAYSGTWSSSSLDQDSFRSRQVENAASAFVEWSHVFAPRGRLAVSLDAEYSRSTLTDADETKVLWDGIDLYPSLSFTYRVYKTNFLQIALNSKKTYPPYWQTTIGRTYLNQYCVTEGNPSLAPSVSYQLNANYIIKQKFVVGVFMDTEPKHSVQMLYQDPTELLAKYRYYNLDQSAKYGILTVIPYSWPWLDANLTVNAFYMRQAGVFEGTRFDRGTIGGRASATFNIYMTKEKNVSAQLSGWYQLPVVQGIYDIDGLSCVTASLTWRPKKTGLSIILKANDVFNTYQMRVSAREAGQNYSFLNDMDMRYVSLTLKYVFNNYEKKSSKTVDTARLGGLN